MTNEARQNVAPVDRLGVLEETDAGWQLRFVRQLGQPPATVWRAFVEPQVVATWFPSSIVGDLVAGAPLTFEIKDFKAEPFGGTVLEVAEPHLLAFTWGADVLRFELAEINGGTELTMTVQLSEYGRAARDGAGWHECLDNLAENSLDSGGTVEAETWATIHPTYVERFGPDAATIGPPQEYDDAQKTRDSTRPSM
jgi:uncharacterized protein YndB with AHSA1/START domain